jgi:hypothetical protein
VAFSLLFGLPAWLYVENVDDAGTEWLLVLGAGWVAFWLIMLCVDVPDPRK